MLKQLLARLQSKPPSRPNDVEPLPTALPTVMHPGSNGQPFPLLAELVAAFSRDDPPEVLIFGDSVTERVSRHDADTRTLGAMVSAALPGRRFHVASRTALNPTLMRALLRVLRRTSRPRLVVMPVNMRAFSPQWDLSPAWALHQELGIVEAWLSNPGLPIPPLFDVRKSEDLYASFDRTPVEYPLSELRSIGEFRRTIAANAEDDVAKQLRKREIFVFHYTHPLVEGHRKLVDLTSAAELCRLIGIEPLLYVTPINVEAGREFIGDAFRDVLAANIERVRAALAPFATLHDHSDALPAADFFAEDLATEHLNQNGRAKLAQRVAQALGA